MESQLQNPEFRTNPENFHPYYCIPTVEKNQQMTKKHEKFPMHFVVTKLIYLGYFFYSIFISGTIMQPVDTYK